MPPVAGNAPAISASVRAPQSAKQPPVTQTRMSGSGPGSFCAIPAGDRKMPDPIVDPTSTAMVLSSPSWRRRDMKPGEEEAPPGGGWGQTESDSLTVEPRGARYHGRAIIHVHTRVVRGLLPQFATAMLRCFDSKIQSR